MFVSALKLSSCMFLLSLVAGAQDTTLSGEVRRMFEKSSAVWLEHYRGFDQSGNPYLLVLGNDMNDEKGILLMTGKKRRWQLEGAYRASVCRYMVTIGELDIWGTAQGARLDSNLVLEMVSSDKAQSLDLRFSRISRHQPVQTPCPFNLKYYAYRDDSSDYLLQFQTFEDGAVQGYCVRKSDSSTWSLSGRCADPSCRRITARTISAGSWNKSSMELKLEEGGKAELKDGAATIHLSAAEQAAWDFTCRNLSTSSRLIHARYPSLDSRSYQKWVQEFVQDWMTASAAKNSSAIDSASNDKLNCAIAWQNPQYVSGYFFWNEAGYRQPVMYPFNVNLRSGDNMELQDLFEKNTDYREVMRNYVDSCKALLLPTLSGKMREHVSRQDFSYWNLLPTGICFFTGMNPVYGMHRILVPYARLDAVLRRNSIIRKNK